jgi:hypothetical protein
MNQVALQLRELLEQLRALVERLDSLPASTERDAAIRDVVRYLDSVNAIIEGQRATTLH